MPGDVDVRRRGDLARDDDQTGGDQGLDRDAALRVLGQQGIEDGVADLVSDLVRVTLGHRLGREKAPCHGSPSDSSCAARPRPRDPPMHRRLTMHLGSMPADFPGVPVTLRIRPLSETRDHILDTQAQVQACGPTATSPTVSDGAQPRIAANRSTSASSSLRRRRFRVVSASTVTCSVRPDLLLVPDSSDDAVDQQQRVVAGLSTRRARVEGLAREEQFPRIAADTVRVEVRQQPYAVRALVRQCRRPAQARPVWPSSSTCGRSSKYGFDEGRRRA